MIRSILRWCGVMMFFNNRTLLIIVAVIILLLAVGFYVSGRSDKEVKDNEVTANDISKSPVSKEADKEIGKDATVKEDVSILNQSPATGPEGLALFLLIPTGILGWNLRRYPHS